MSWSAGLILLLAASQIPAELIKPVYLNNADIEVAAEGAGGSSRIVSGWEAVDGQFPHQVSLRMIDPRGGVTGCGGSIVHRSWVITAAHCTGNRITTVVRAGVTALSRPEYIWETLEWYIPESYNLSSPFVQPDDISLLKLQRPLTFSKFIQPIRIQSRADAHRDYDGQIATASGWGMTWTNGLQPEVMNWVFLRPTANVDCEEIYGEDIVTANTICAGPYNVTSQSVCQGDSGGPLTVIGADGQLDLIGVASFVPSAQFQGCHSGYPGGFCRPGPFHDWFYMVTGIDFENLTEEPSTTSAPITTTSAPEPEESEEDSSSSESEEDDVISDILRKLIVKVKVKVKVNDKTKRSIKIKCKDTF